MEMSEAIKKVLQEVIVPELNEIKAEYNEIKTILQFTNKRLDDINAQLIDQSRRIDDTNKRIDKLYEVIVRRDEHQSLQLRVQKLEYDIMEIKNKLVA